MQEFNVDQKSLLSHPLFTLKSSKYQPFRPLRQLGLNVYNTNMSCTDVNS